MRSKLSSNQPHTKKGDLVQLVTDRDNSFIIKLESGKVFQSHHGLIHHDNLIDLLWGSRVKTHLGKIFIILQPALDDLIRSIPRATQIIYPKDIGYIIVTMGIGPGSKMIEVGTGSGALTTALAYIVGDKGRVISYDKEEKNIQIAKNNLSLFGLENNVTFKIRDIADGFDETNVQAVFLDVPNPEDYCLQIREPLIPGGYFGCILPTVNQVSKLITSLKKHNFSFIEASEILHRYYKTTATRFRPEDKMVSHTGYLVFARKIAKQGETIE
jgi:tRNA (adenine57-N1/adenine58-N1)-methyltransferase